MTSLSRETTIEVVYVDMDDVSCAYLTAHATALRNHPDVAFPQSVPEG